MLISNQYRTHYCGELNSSSIDKTVILSGWMHAVRDHGGLMFIDLRDQQGITQIVIDQKSHLFKEIENLKLESVICVTGKVIPRSQETVNEVKKSNKLFINFYSNKVLGNTKNFYAVSKNNSKISLNKYLNFAKKNKLYLKKNK